jgi:hypothetical protein
MMLDGNSDGTPGDDFSMSFFQLKGDTNRDRQVDAADLATVTRHLGHAAATLAEGDLNYDNKVDFRDFQAMELAFGNSLPSPVVAAAQNAAALAKSAKIAKPNTRKAIPTIPTTLLRPHFSTQPVRRRMELLESIERA